MDSYIVLFSHIHIYEGFVYEDQLNSLFYSDKTRKLLNVKQKKNQNRDNKLLDPLNTADPVQT